MKNLLIRLRNYCQIAMAKKDILIFHSSNDLYGASKILLQVINLLKNDYVIHIFLPYNGPLDKILSQHNISLNYMDFGVLRKKYFSLFGLPNRLFKILASVFIINRYIKKNRIDFIYTNTSIIIASGISAFMCKIPNYLHIHEIPDNKIYSKIMGVLISKFSSKIIVVSNSVKDYWSSHVKIKLNLIYNGIPFNFKKRLIKKESKKIKFLTIARLLPYKGHKYIIEIANHLLNLNLNAEFIFLGDVFKGYENYEKELKYIVNSNGITKNILFKGFDPKIEKYLKSSDFLLHGAIKPDPLPTVIFEAIQNNLPVIATNIGGAVEILDGGKGGLLISENDSMNASRDILEYVKNTELVKKKNEYALKFINENFSEETFNKKILHFFSL